MLLNSMQLLDKDFKEIFSAELISIIGSLITGIFLAVYTDKIFLIPGMLILLPGFLEMRGNISGTLSSRISSGLFLKVIKKEKMNTPLIWANILASSILALFVSLCLGLIAFLCNYLILKVIVFKIILLPVIAGILSNIIEITITLFTTFYLFRRGHDPNNIMGPFITSTGDITSIISLLVTLSIL